MQGVVEFLKAWQLHPVVDHFTIALILVGILVDLFASLVPSRMWLRYMAVTLMVLGALAAAGSDVTGGWEAERLWDHLTGPAKDVLERHGWWGSYLPWALGILALWRLGLQFVGFLKGTRFIYLLVAIVAGGLILYQGSLGGELVYDYGVGTAPMSNGTPAPVLAGTPTVAIEPTSLPTVYVPSPSATPAPSAAASPVAAAPLSTPSPAPSGTATGIAPSATPSAAKSATL